MGNAQRQPPLNSTTLSYGGGSAGTYRGFDEMGRVVRQYQQTDSVNYLTEAAYYVNSSMHTETYPSVPGASDRRTVTFTPDNAGRLSSLSSSATSYAPAASVSSIGYASQNALSNETYGNSLIHAVSYNNRLQPSEIKLGTSGNSTSVIDLTYSYGTTSNNGNVQSVTYAGGGLSYTQSFSYDTLNRLSSATETTGSTTNWTQNNHYDLYGNRQIDYGGGSYNLAFSSGTNRITTSGYSYDSSGNLTNDGTHAYGFDAEGKIKSVDSTTAYTYDGEGHRVKKLVGENTRFIYGVGGQLVAEYDGSSGNLKKEYIYGAGVITIEPTAVNSNGTQYASGDHLGSPRVITNSGASVVSRHDYMPFGEELGSGSGGRTTGMGFSNSGDNNRKQFTGYERDAETGLDFAQARFYGSTQGRFTSPDPFSGSASVANPQTFNRYAYVGNNPVNSVDPSGLAAAGPMGQAQQLTGQRGSAARAMGEEGRALIAEEEGEYEDMRDYHWSGQAAFDRALAHQAPQNSLDSPLAIESSPNLDANMTVAFHGSYEDGIPNGPGEVTTVRSGRVHGLGFTVYGSVASGGIGHIQDDLNKHDPKGAWTIQQFASAYTEINGKVDRNGGKMRPDLDSGDPHQISGNQFRRYDHPGVPTRRLTSYLGKFNFSAKVVNGSKQCEIQFRVLITFSNGNWSVRWGRGQFR